MRQATCPAQPWQVFGEGHTRCHHTHPAGPFPPHPRDKPPPHMTPVATFISIFLLKIKKAWYFLSHN